MMTCGSRSSFPPARLEFLKSLGCFTEIIQYKTRLFVPARNAEDILSAMAAPLSKGSDLAA